MRKKLNNFGMTLVELIIAFSILMIIIVGLYNLILDIKTQFEDKQNAKAITEFSSTINHQIHYSLINSKVEDLLKINGSNMDCLKGTCSFKNNINQDYNICFNSSNCIIYSFKENTKLKYRIVSLSEEGAVVGYLELKDSKLVYETTTGFDEFPILRKYVSFENEDKKISIDYKDGVLSINYPIYLASDENKLHNYGFKIASKIG